jgi:hypothetical protein
MLTREFHLNDVGKLWDSILMKCDFTKYNNKFNGKFDIVQKY